MHIGDPRLCNQCNYDLSGLGEQGHCPECGQAYNLRSGQGLRSRADDMQRWSRMFDRIRTITLLAIGGSIFFAGLLIQLMFKPATYRTIAVASLFAIIFVLFGVVSFLGEKAKH